MATERADAASFPRIDNRSLQDFIDGSVDGRRTGVDIDVSPASSAIHLPAF